MMKGIQELKHYNDKFRDIVPGNVYCVGETQALCGSLRVNLQKEVVKGGAAEANRSLGFVSSKLKSCKQERSGISFVF